MRFLPYSRQSIDNEDVKKVVDVLTQDLITQGPRTEEFEKSFADYVGARYAVSCSSGTAALHIACLALGLDPGDALVTTPITFLSSANCAQFVGATTLFSDIDETTWCLSVPELEKHLRNQKVSTVVPVHFAGNCVDLEALKTLQELYGFRILEDASHALGAEYKGSKVGSCNYSEITVFSFHPVKHITTGEGGALTTNDETLYRRMIRFRSHGIHRQIDHFKNRGLAIDKDGEQNSWYYEMSEIGYNYRISDIQCALGSSQLRKIDKFTDRRRVIASKYDRSFVDLPGIRIPVEQAWTRHSYHLYTILIDFDKIGLTRNEVMKELRGNNIGTQVHYIPVHLQPYYMKKYDYKIGDFPKAEKYYSQCLSIPMFPDMTAREIDAVIKSIKNFVSC